MAKDNIFRIIYLNDGTKMMHRSTKEGQKMERYTELLYWLDFKQYIHYDEKTNTFSYDPDIPERARISHEMWLKHNGFDK